MTGLVICEICGTSFYTTTSLEVCASCLKGNKKTDKDTKVAQSMRADAKKLGAKALKGTPKQKKWGESLRCDFIKNASDTEAIKALVCSSSLENAKFWIENRGNAHLEADLVEIMAITAALNSGKEADTTRRAELIEKLGI